MSRSKQHHYLPAQAYLRHFSAERSGFVYLYERDRAPVLVSITNLAKEHHLYSFEDAQGRRNTDVEEKLLARLDAAAQPLLDTLNAAEGSTALSDDDYQTLLLFVAFLIVRTPAYRDQINQSMGAMLREVSMAHAASKERFHRYFLRTAPKIGIDPAKVNIDELRDFRAQGEYRVEQQSAGWTLAQIIQHALALLCILEGKEPSLFQTSLDEPFLTSDHPVCRLPEPDDDIPAGYRDATLVVPLGRTSLLHLEANCPPEIQLDETVPIPVRLVRPHGVRQLNRIIIEQAERFLFGSAANRHIQKILDQTPPPTRFTVETIPKGDGVTVVTSTKIKRPTKTRTKKI